MKSLTRRLIPAASSLVLASALSGCCMLQEGAYCIRQSFIHKDNSRESLTIYERQQVALANTNSLDSIYSVKNRPNIQ